MPSPSPPTSAAVALSDSNRKWIIAAVVVASLASIGALYYSRSSGSDSASGRPARPSTKSRKAPAPDNDATPASPTKPKQSPPSPTKKSTPEKAASTPLPPSPEKRSAESAAAATASTGATTTTTVESTELKSKLNPKQKEELAQKLKNQGNDLYKAGKFAEAVSYYTRAIEMQPTSAVYWCNRAACYANLNEPNKVIEDCTKALELDATYVKALHRRAIAFEQLNKLREALYDFATMTILDGYKNPNATNAAERLVKLLAEEQAKELLPNKVPVLPSSTFVQAYLEAFRPIPCEALDAPLDELPKDSAAFHLKRALDAITKRDYDAADADLEQAVKAIDDDQQDEVAAYAWNMHGTFLFLKGQVDAAAECMEKSLLIDGTNINTMIKCSNLLMEQGDTNATLQTFDKALQITESDPDIFYHRGQVKFLLNDFGGACLDYQKSIDLDAKFPAAYIQLGVSQYKLGSIQTAMGTFKTAMSLFPESGDVYNYYAELLQDQGRFQEASEYYDKAIALAPHQPMAYVNKAMLMFQVYQDPEASDKLLRAALEQDPKCDLVYVQLANFLLPMGKVDEAIECFDKAVALARTLPELVNVLMAKEQVLAQYHVTQVLPPAVIAEGFK
ncbi:hypothetical protein BCR44DRAFT_159291 [Catenaria anguillulae PL171]|uniref:Uncharacterized protein n=1 Tax=Catenaria anguillulae PL171 TaxID=765915 RepID=A0A1Y2HY84_9FUNG|nr:hypothetical protein BCR44DRAFT_159291 [Catenaria anguillulae PL171]